MSGTNGALAAGEKIQVSSDGGATWHDVTQTGTSWSYDDTANPHATSFTYTARMVDTAGNIGTTDQPGRHHRYGSADRDAGDHRDCRRHRHVSRATSSPATPR